VLVNKVGYLIMMIVYGAILDVVVLLANRRKKHVELG